MGAKEMAEKIKGEANKESEKIIREAKEKAKKKLEDAIKEIEEEKKRFVEAEERKGVEEKERIIRAARQKVRKLRWTVEEEMIEKALDATRKRVKDVKSEGFKGDSYPNILAGLIKDSAISIAAGSSAGAEVEVILSEEDAAASYIDKVMLKSLTDEISNDSGINVRLSLSDDRIKSAGGVILRRKDGEREVNNTFEQRMARLSTSLREDIVKTLFTGT